MVLEFSGTDAVRVALGKRAVPAMLSRAGRRALVTLAEPVEIRAGEALEISLG
jgi:hypothetical protein